MAVEEIEPLIVTLWLGRDSVTNTLVNFAAPIVKLAAVALEHVEAPPIKTEQARETC